MYDAPDSLPNFDISPPLQSPAPAAAPAAPASSTPVVSDAVSSRNSFNPIEVGVVYSVESQDDLWHIAQRFGVDMADVLFWNPDLADGQAKQHQYKLFRSPPRGSLSHTHTVERAPGILVRTHISRLFILLMTHVCAGLYVYRLFELCWYKCMCWYICMC